MPMREMKLKHPSAFRKVTSLNSLLSRLFSGVCGVFAAVDVLFRLVLIYLAVCRIFVE